MTDSAGAPESSSTQYSLPGIENLPQVEPGASAWFRCPTPTVVSYERVTKRLQGKTDSYPEIGSPEEQKELEELRQFAANAEDANALDQNSLSAFLTNRRFVSPPPAGAVLSKRTDTNSPIIRNGLELAYLFQSETPGIWHRHILNFILAPEPESSLGLRLSPPRHALIWATLDVAIHSALMAAWHYKWVAVEADGTKLDRVAFRRRPAEADPSLEIVYDFMSNDETKDGSLTRGEKRLEPQPSPGTPRHPAYPSGHSTYSAAASYVLGCLLPEFKEDFDKLADNIGEARIWGGVHWRSDHDFGQLVGRTVGELVIRQLNKSGIVVCPEPNSEVPARDELEAAAKQFDSNCGEADNNFCSGVDCSTQPEVIQNL
ncbi:MULTISPECIES: vanadium-dependent haloperoxidase [Cyanophyceae]|uniref:Vanadium-dependent haloperoxidase n=1 Tax=Leptolyngbya subtilissima DQ-A4 TaxID=2933933 RepID=A0ABV0KA70_9CYAN|nr:vanadium-dependent haloperoxidase [Nodosilinea sp. FACHB-141]MBD2115164.1 vanadium-dependent haloperoxidase [Nodosilinea sp. FACHB-141]